MFAYAFGIILFIEKNEDTNECPATVSISKS